MLSGLRHFFNTRANRQRRINPTRTEGAAGTAIYGGFVQTGERSPDLASPEARGEAFSRVLLNTGIVSAGVLFFTDLLASATWSFKPAEADTSEDWAKMAESLLFVDPETTWRRIVRRAGMYRFWGFSWAEWTMRRADMGGHLTYLDVEPRAQRTIEYWDTGDTGKVDGVWQRSPQNHDYIYLDRRKAFYNVDDTLNDSPEGLGLFRLMYESATRLKQFERLQGLGYERDMRGALKLRSPKAELQRLVNEGKLTQGRMNAILDPFQNLQRGFVAGKLATFDLDSAVYESQDQAGRPSTVPLYDAEIMSGGATGFDAMLKAIEWYQWDLARMMGMQGMMIGKESGSYALSRDNTNVLNLRVSGTLDAIRAQAEQDLLKQAWVRNGWSMDVMPALTVSPPTYMPPEAMAAAVKGIAESLKVVDDTAIIDESELENAAMKLVDVIEQVDASISSGGGKLA